MLVMSRTRLLGPKTINVDNFHKIVAQCIQTEN